MAPRGALATTAIRAKATSASKQSCRETSSHATTSSTKSVRSASATANLKAAGGRGSTAIKKLSAPRGGGFTHAAAAMKASSAFEKHITETITTTTRVITQTSSANQAQVKAVVGKRTRAAAPTRSTSKPAVREVGQTGAKPAPKPRRPSAASALGALPRLPALMGVGNNQLMIGQGQDMSGMNGWIFPF